ncbi:major facilitator superfamily domain-containing protein [Glomus cerebriforme]|uniref:Major facilitator superfamily domain-containing protein n=1 Tax=Glomus cerebriforme TaxID=658196 RepID=A0A397SAL2_9GLOM|nr:major facilitator superfamily domain-containing protein [Glomus cerebriforme]
MTDNGELPHQKSSSEDEEDDELSHKSLSEHHYDPQRWPYLKKYRILFFVALPTFLTPLSNVSLYSAILEMKEEFKTTVIYSLLGIFIIFRGIAPIFWSSYSDQLGTRKKVYLASLLLYTIGNILCGFTKNVLVLIIFRVVQTIGISAALSLGGGTVGDIFIPAERGKAYAIYLIGYFVALAIGPFIGVLIAQLLGWRWIFHILAISGGVTLLSITSFLPETFRPSGEKLSPKPHQILIIRESYPRSPSEESKTFLPRKRYNPLSPLKLLLQLNVTLSILSKSLAYLIIYTQNTLITRLLSYYYDVSIVYVVFAYISPPVGYLVGSLFAGIYSDHLVGYERDIEMRKEKEMRREEKRRKKRDEVTKIMQEISGSDVIYKFPMMRIKVAFYSSLLVPLFIAAFGWLAQNRVHIVLPLICSFIAGIGLQGQCNCISTYLIDAYSGKSASALALSDFFSFLLVAIITVFTTQLENFIGTGWTFSVMAIFSILSIIFLIIVLKYDEKWRGVNT